MALKSHMLSPHVARRINMFIKLINLFGFLSLINYSTSAEDIILCYECSSSLNSTLSEEAGCQNNEPCCRDPFNFRESHMTQPFVRECTSGLCLKTTYSWRYNKIPSMYQDAKSEEALLQIKDKKCVHQYRDTPNGQYLINVCACDTDYCNSAHKINLYFTFIIAIIANLILSQNSFFNF